MGEEENRQRVNKQFTANVPPPAKLSLSGNLAQNWKKFKRQFQTYAVASRLQREDDPEYRCAVFLATIGEDAFDIFDTFKFDNAEDSNNLEIVMSKFEEYFVGETHEAYESYRFHLRRQEPSESIEAYIAELRKLAKTCNFGPMEDRLIRDQVVVGVREDLLREKLLEDKGLTLDKCLQLGRAYETAKQQSKNIAAGTETPSVQSVQHRKYGAKMHKPNREKEHSRPTVRKCTRCGKHEVHDKKNCPAKDAECRKCKKKGHYAAMCRSNVRCVQTTGEDDNVLGCVETIGAIDNDMWHAQINVTTAIRSKVINFRLDTGADVTVIPERFFLKNSPLIQKTTKKLYGPGHSELNVVGRVQATLTTDKTMTQQDLYVVTGLKEPLLGKPAIEALHLIERVNSIKQGMCQYKREFPELFTGLGKLKTVYTIRLSENAQPFSIATPRRLPLPMMKKVQDELKRLEEDDIIRPVTTPTDWCAPIVVVPKQKDKVRLCVDLTKLNESVKREKFPLPTTDQLLAQLSGATVFSKLDCNSGFHQIPLHEDSQELTTFITPFGRYCYKRLPFGISSGPEVFHREMTHLLAGIPGVICDIDDVLISGRNQQEHDSRVRTVLQRMKAAGVTLNEKCDFSASSIKFLGHIISAVGIQIDPEKVDAIKKLPRPENVSELRRILGMVNHVGKFAPNLTETTKPLRDLLKKENIWTWDAPQERAFQTLKTQLSSTPVLIHYCTDRPTKISADSSSYGMGGVLLQKERDDWKPVFYASRSLSNTEQRYAQVEKEALAVTWCCEKFSDFLIGLPRFTIETDHKPLLALLKSKQLDELTPRIQRFRMRLMRFSYDIMYTAGKNLMTADTLSRAPVSVPAEQDRQKEAQTDAFVRGVIDGFPASDKRLEEIRKKQLTDKLCSQVMNFCKQDYWPESAKHDQELKQYWFVRSEMTVQHGLLLYQSRLVIPAELQKDILQRLHEGHQGIVKCRALARSCVWWPGLSKQIEKEVGACATCEKERVHHPEPLLPSKTPDYPWQRVGMDLFELKGHQYLLIVDYYSRWIEFAHLTQTTSKSVIEHCKSIFARQGIPEVVVSDNGPQFSSREFLTFADSYGFTHLTSSPHHPQGNGEAERAVQTLKNLLKKAEDPYLAVLNYRATPLQNGSSPAELLMGRKLRTRVPTLPDKHVPSTADHEMFKMIDSHIKARQKMDFDRRHRAQVLPPLTMGQPVFTKSPGTKVEEAEVVGTSSPPEKSFARSYEVKSSVNAQSKRRNRAHLRRRSQPLRTPSSAPKATCTIPDMPIDQATYNAQHDNDDDDDAVLTNVQPTVHPGRAIVVTRSGRHVKAPEKLNL